MERIEISALDNIFEIGNLTKGHISIVGKETKSRKELMKQLIGSLLKSGNKVIWFNNQEKTINNLKKLNPYHIRCREDFSPAILETKSFIIIDTLDIDLDFLKKFLKESIKEWYLIQEDLDSLVTNYEHNEFITQKLDFYHYISEFGRVFGIYMVGVISNLEKVHSIPVSRKIIENSKNILMLQQVKASNHYLKKVNWITDSQVEKIRNLDAYEAVLLKK